MAFSNLMIVATVFLIGFFMIAFLIWGLKKAVKLAINSIIGFFALWLTKELFLPTLDISFWSVIITAIFGILGYVVVIILHFVGIF